jgi:hypothetical protein
VTIYDQYEKYVSDKLLKEDFIVGKDLNLQLQKKFSVTPFEDAYHSYQQGKISFTDLVRILNNEYSPKCLGC